jgi:2-dehydro-3-deoxy-D-pentonate aldolase
MFTGSIPAMVTPFDERGEIDLRATEAVVERFVAAGVDGISVLGSTGEFPHLTFDERKRFAEETVGIAAGRVPLIVGVGSSGTREAVELARHAESVDADAVLVVSPFYWNVGEEALFEHFTAVAGAVSVPTLLYNLPLLTGINLSPSLVASVANGCPNVTGLKDTVTEYSHTVNVLREVKPTRPDFSVLAGFEDLILPSMLAGGDGTICGLFNVVPELFIGMVRSVQNGELDEAAKLHRRVLSLMTLGSFSDTPLGAIKLAMNVLGVPISPTVRGPALPAPEEARKGIEDTLREASLPAARETEFGPSWRP